MKSRIVLLLIAIHSLLLALGGIAGIFVFSFIVERPSEQNTTEFSATIESVEVVGEGKDAYGLINTVESDEALQVFNIEIVADMDSFRNLSPGQLIYYRIENTWLGEPTYVRAYNIVSLRTSFSEIVTLDSYNNYLDSDGVLLYITCAIFVPTLLFVFIYCMHTLKKKTKSQMQS